MAVLLTSPLSPWPAYLPLSCHGDCLLNFFAGRKHDKKTGESAARPECDCFFFALMAQTFCQIEECKNPRNVGHSHNWNLLSLCTLCFCFIVFVLWHSVLQLSSVFSAWWLLCWVTSCNIPFQIQLDAALLINPFLATVLHHVISSFLASVVHYLINPFLAKEFVVLVQFPPRDSTWERLSSSQIVRCAIWNCCLHIRRVFKCAFAYDGVWSFWGNSVRLTGC